MRDDGDLLILDLHAAALFSIHRKCGHVVVHNVHYPTSPPAPASSPVSRFSSPPQLSSGLDVSPDGWTPSSEAVPALVPAAAATGHAKLSHAAASRGPSSRRDVRCAAISPATCAQP